MLVDPGQKTTPRAEESRQKLKRDALTQVHETELFGLSFSGLRRESVICGCKGLLPRSSDLSGSSSNEFYCRETSVKCIKGPGVEETTVIAGVMVGDSSEQEVDLLVPSTQPVIKGRDYGTEAKYPSGNNAFTALLLALRPQTWLGIKDQTLQNKTKKLVSIGTLSTMQHEEVSHLQGQLILLKRCQENKEEDDLTAPPN